MKSFIAILSLVTVISAQAATVSKQTVSSIASRIEVQRVTLDDKVSNANTDDIVEGKVVATMSNQVEVLLKTAQQMLDSAAAAKKLTKAEVAEKVSDINAVLEVAKLLTSEI